ncbi:Trk system potassium transporter TrkA [Microvenator marinus]|uniref:Trk system potassium uptake protein TrkA n=1 Tax=Microvenator marinus TaxID=2600177 RepID=A0A5B8XVS5_9DELT|nr:Trk system potassium transporter TrkA [Microvenator marinus]QED29271.1 Trk system potassium transporter TrkA [Microvenator marinus]
MRTMKIVVVGAGQVGRSVASELAKVHDLVVIDSEAERLEDLRHSVDVMTIEGDGADLEILKEAGVPEADIIIASTDDDRVNILVCGIARMLSEELFTICRVADTAYLRSWEHTRKAFQVDLMVGSNFLTAQSIDNVLSEELARDVAYFDNGRIEMAEYVIPEDCELAAKQIKDTKIPEGVRLAAVFDGQKMEVATGATWMRAGNRVLVIGESEEVAGFGNRLARSQDSKLGKDPSKNRVKRWLKRKQKDNLNVFILGGGEVGLQTATLLEKRGLSPKLVESDAKRAELLARALPKSFVLNDDIKNPGFIRTEGLSRADLVIVCLSTDELNLFASVLALDVGAKKVVSVIHSIEFQPLFDRSGVELTFNPRTEVIKEIIRHTRGKRLDKIAFVEGHKGEVIQITLDENSALVGKPLQEATQDLPGKLVIGAASRNDVVIIPNGKTVLEPGDRLVVFLDTTDVAAMMEAL